MASNLNTLRETYDEYAAEQRACGYEVESFAEWLGPDLAKLYGLRYESAREQAEARLAIPSHDLDLY